MDASDKQNMREAEWELQRYEQFRSTAVEVINTHEFCAIFNMKTGELKLFDTVKAHIDYDCVCILKGTPRILIEPREGYFQVLLESELVIKKELYKDGVFEPVYEHIIEDCPELQFDPQALIDALSVALAKAMSSE